MTLLRRSRANAPARSRHRRWSGVLGLLVAVAAALLTLTDAVERLELRTHDLRFAVRGPRQTHAPLVIVELPDSDPEPGAVYNEDAGGWHEPMLFWGRRYASVIRQARRYGAAWVALDVIPHAPADDYLEQVGANPERRPDEVFVRAVDEAANTVILPQVLREGHWPISPHFSLLEAVTEANIGFANLNMTPDAVVRLAYLYANLPKMRPSFPALIAARALGVPPEDAAALHRLARRPFPIHGGMGFWINYTLRDAARARISAVRMEQGRLSAPQRRALRGAVVVVGRADRPADDTYGAIGGQEMAGIEVNAEAIATLLDGRALGRWSRPREAALTLLLSLLLLGAAICLPTGWGAPAVLAAEGMWCVACQHAFAAHDLLLPVVGPVVGMALPAAVFRAMRAVEDRLRIERTFGRYLSDEIRDFLLDTPAHRDMGGAERDAAVLFFDIRGSVAFAEDRPPAQVMDELNMLFRELVPILDREGGLLYRYTGDGFLAVFGAPYPRPNPAQAAVDAAIAIVARVAELNRTGGQTWRAGCGVHTGPLACGSLGVDERSEFTVIGDTVNLAARLESLNKALGSVLVVSGETYERLSSPPAMRGPAVRKVPGRAKAATIHYLRAAVPPRRRPRRRSLAPPSALRPHRPTGKRRARPTVPAPRRTGDRDAGSELNGAPAAPSTPPAHGIPRERPDASVVP